jgi:hypothetical protein
MTEIPTEELRNQYPLAQFAAKYWADHAQRHGSTLKSVHELAMEHMSTQHTLRICLGLYRCESFEKNDVETKHSNLYYASYSGLISGVKALIREGADINAKHRSYGLALQTVSSEGHLDIVRILLEYKS